VSQLTERKKSLPLNSNCQSTLNPEAFGECRLKFQAGPTRFAMWATMSSFLPARSYFVTKNCSTRYTNTPRSLSRCGTPNGDGWFGTSTCSLAERSGRYFRQLPITCSGAPDFLRLLGERVGTCRIGGEHRIAWERCPPNSLARPAICRRYDRRSWGCLAVRREEDQDTVQLVHPRRGSSGVHGSRLDSHRWSARLPG